MDVYVSRGNDKAVKVGVINLKDEGNRISEKKPQLCEQQQGLAKHKTPSLLEPKP